MSAFFKKLGRSLDPNKNGVARAFNPSQNGVARTVNRTFSKIGSQGAGVFHKVVDDAGKVFNKQTGEQILGEISSDLAKGASVASTINKYGNQVLNNPAVMALVATQPELQPFYAGLKAGNAGIGLAGQGANQLANLTNKDGYSGNAGQVAKQVIEKVVPVINTGVQAKSQGFI